MAPCVVFAATWDVDGPLPPVVAERQVVSALPGPSSKRLVRPVPAVRVDRSGRLAVLAEVPGPEGGPQPAYRLVGVDTTGAVAGWSAVAPDAGYVSGWHVLDFQPDQCGGVYLLEVLQGPSQEFEHRLRRVGPDGDTVWFRRGPLNTRVLDFTELAGKFERLLVPDDDSVYLASRYPVQGLARFDAESGDLVTTYDMEEPHDHLTLDAAHWAYYSRMLDEGGPPRLVVIRRSLETGEREVIEPETALFTDLAGVDEAGNLFARLPGGLVRLTPAGRVSWRFDPHGIVVRAEDRHLFLIRHASSDNGRATVTIEHRRTDGTALGAVTVEIGAELAKPGVVPDLVDVDAEGTATLYAGETQECPGVRYIVDAGGTLVDVAPLAGPDEDEALWDRVNEELLPVESRVAGASAFQVDAGGRVYVPLSDPVGYRVVRLTDD